MNWDINKLNTTKLTTDKDMPLFPRRLLFALGWNVPEYCEMRLKFSAEMLQPNEMAYFEQLKNKIEESLCWVQELALNGRITANMYEATVREFETYGRSIKDTAVNMQDRYAKLKKQKETQKNISSIKLI